MPTKAGWERILSVEVAARRAAERRVALLERAGESLLAALIASNSITRTPEEQGRIAADAIDRYQAVLKGKNLD